MLADKLQRIAERIDGVRALSLVAGDGIPIETLALDDGATDADLDALAAELLTQMRSISEDQREYALGRVLEFAVSTDRLTVLVGQVIPGYYLLSILGPGASLGRARFELRRSPLLLEEELA